jgi:transketolase C-terminal domain/subunit
VPQLLDEKGKPYYTDAYQFVPGKDEILLQGSDGYVVAFGDALYRANDAVQRLRSEGIKVGLVNKVTLNVLDEETTRKVGSTGFVLVVEPISKTSGVGVHYGYWLMKLGLSPAYNHIGAHKNGSGGLWEQAYHQGYDSGSIQKAVKELVKGKKTGASPRRTAEAPQYGNSNSYQQQSGGAQGYSPNRGGYGGGGGYGRPY